MKSLDDLKIALGDLVKVALAENPSGLDIERARSRVVDIWADRDFSRFRENFGKFAGTVAPQVLNGATPEENPYWNNYVATIKSFRAVVEYDGEPQGLAEIAGLLGTNVSTMRLHVEDFEEYHKPRS
jgi:hypothetical protein